MKRSVKILISFGLLLLVVALSSIYFISTKINPEMIKKLSVEAIEENLVDTKAEITQVDYTLGTSVKLFVKGINLTRKSDRSKLLEFALIEVNIPLLAILTSGGVIEISADAPIIYVNQKNEKINWLEVIASKETKKAEVNQVKNTQKHTKEFKIPDFVERSKLNFKLNNLKVLMDLGEFKKSTVDVNRITVKNLNFIKSTAFEIQTSVNYQLAKEQYFKTEIQSIGEIFLKDLIENNKLNLTTTLKINNTSLDGVEVKIPTIKGKIKANGEFDDLNSLVDLTFDNVGNLNTEMLMQKDLLTVSKLNLRIKPENVLKLLPTENSASLKAVKLDDTEFVVEGNSTLELGSLSLAPNLVFYTTKNVTLDLGSPLEVASIISGKLTNKNLNLEVKSTTLEGQILTKVETQIDPMNLPQEFNQYGPIKVNIALTDMKLSRRYLQDKLWGQKKNPSTSQNEPNPAESPENSSATKLLLPSVEVNLAGKRIFVADQEISLQGKINVQDDKIRSQEFDLRYGKGKVGTDFNILLVDSKNYNADFQLDFRDVQLAGFNAFFPQYLSELNGNFVGKVEGKIQIGNELNYNLLAKMRGTNGEMKDLDVVKIIGPLLSSINWLKGKIPEKQNVSNKFDKLYVDTQVTNQKIEINKLEVIGHKKEFDIGVSGKVSMLDGPSVLTGELYSQLIPKEFVKTFGLKKIPFRLKGTGFAIYQPDYDYTNKRLQKAGGKTLEKNAKQELKRAETKAKKMLKKEETKMKANIKKEEKKIKQKLEDELKNKLKGIKF